MPKARTPLPVPPRWRGVAEFLFWTALSLGSYPFYAAAKQAPRLNREALLLRAEYLSSTAPGATSWPWIKKAWVAWLCEFCLAESLAVFCGAFMGTLATGTLARALKATGQLPTSGMVAFYLAAALILAPQGYLLTRLALLLGHTFWPDRLIRHVGTRYRESLERAAARFGKTKEAS